MAQSEVKMNIKSDIEISQSIPKDPIEKVAEKIGIPREHLELYGNFKAKISFDLQEKIKERKNGKLILITAINPTPAGEGKTTTSIGLGDALARLGKKVIITLREPSLGPVFGVKGGATGGGYSQVVPMEDINLHFTGDIHAVGTANNLLAAMMDNHIYQGNALRIDPQKITWRRCMDMNERQLRFIVSGLNGKANGIPREEGFDITAASEVMAILCLSSNIDNLKENLERIIVGYTYDDRSVTAGDLKAAGAMAALLREALKPNLVQTLEHTPVFIHGGPFGNIAHGCNSIIATETALKLADYVVTESGFGADLGAEKFCDIKCRKSGLKPDGVVIVASIRALKHHGGASKNELYSENLTALNKGIPNLLKHIETMKQKFGLPVVVAINKFPADSPWELKLVEEECQKLGVPVAISEVWEKGGEGGIELAQKVLELLEKSPNHFRFLYDLDLTLKEKIEIIVREVYGGDEVVYLPQAEKDLEKLEKNGFGKLPICMAKTQYSLSDDPKKLGRPVGFQITIRNVKVSAGAGFVVPLAGDIMTMPGLPKVPAAEQVTVDSQGRILGLF